MRHALSRLLTLGLPALLLVAGVFLWSGAQSGESIHHPEGAHAAPCHEQADSTVPAHAPAPADHQCPDCRCLFAGCTTSITLPGMTAETPAAFTLAPPLACAPARLVAQALNGPPPEPPRL
jgi:hypothetical protein